MFLYADIRSKSTTPQRVALASMFKEAGLRSPRTQLTKVKIEISVLGQRTEARSLVDRTSGNRCTTMLKVTFAFEVFTMILEFVLNCLK